MSMLTKEQLAEIRRFAERIRQAYPPPTGHPTFGNDVYVNMMALLDEITRLNDEVHSIRQRVHQAYHVGEGTIEECEKGICNDVC